MLNVDAIKKKQVPANMEMGLCQRDWTRILLCATKVKEGLSGREDT